MILKLKNANFINVKAPISINDIDINKVVVSNKQKLEKYVYVVSNNETEIYSVEENSANYDDENLKKFILIILTTKILIKIILMILMILTMKILMKKILMMKF